MSFRHRPEIRTTIIRILCVLLLVQGYPIWALEQAGVRAEPDFPPVREKLTEWFEESGLTDVHWSTPWRPA